jgi:hypothetical protein
MVPQNWAKFGSGFNNGFTGFEDAGLKPRTGSVAELTLTVSAANQ